MSKYYIGGTTKTSSSSSSSTTSATGRYIIGSSTNSSKSSKTPAFKTNRRRYSKSSKYSHNESSSIYYSSVLHRNTPTDYDTASYKNYKYKYASALSTLSGDDIDDVVENLNHTVSMVSPTTTGVFNIQTKYYNRFKTPILNEPLGNGFAHVYFVRPNLNILSSTGGALNDQLASDSFMKYVWNKNPKILQQLVCSTADDDTTHDWMLYLSNKAENFTLADEVLSTATYGKTWAGMSISYGRTTTESRAAGDFSITYHDDRNFSVYLLHKAWVEYINNVYHGKWVPKLEDMKAKIIDYSTCCYYIVTAEDDETILFWTKYYGVYPSTVPVSHMGWQKGQLINTIDTSMSVTYQYSFKVDMDYYNLYEFNLNSNVIGESPAYQATYDSALGHAGTSWVGVPFIEVDNSDNYRFILRHEAKDLSYS